MNFINLATMDSRNAADNLAEKLSQEGITARLHNEEDVQRFIFFTRPKGHFIVQVHEQDYSEAVACILKLHDAQDSICDHIFNCPECGSLAVEYPQFTRKYFITPLLIEWASNFGLFEKQFYCRKCHWTWLPAAASRLPQLSHDRQVLVAPPD